MNRNLFDDDDDWLKPKNTANNLWDDDSTSSDNEPSTSTTVKFNPKVLAIVAAVVVGLILIGLVFRAFSGSESVEPRDVASTLDVSNVDFYAQPKNLQSFIDTALASTVTLYCGDYLGTGWVIDLSDDSSSAEDDDYPTEIITNFHVIEQCQYGYAVTTQAFGDSNTFDSYIYSYDVDNDLAVLITDRDLPSLPTQSDSSKIKVGHWVMATGSPTADVEILEGSVTIGTITNLRSNAVVTDTALNPGNSGGPLINAAGQVIAINTEKIMDVGVDNISFSRKLELLCLQLNSCSSKRILR